MSTTQDNGFTIDVQGFRSQARKFAQRYGIGVHAVMMDQMRLWSGDLVKRTYPETYAQGRRAVDADLRKLFVPVDDRAVLDFFYDKFQAQLREEQIIINVDGNAARMKGWHEANRKSRGRVRRSERIKEIGGFKFVNKMYVPGARYRQYRKLRQKNVGRLKRGWVPAARHYGAKVPGWVGKHVKNEGRYQDRMSRDGNGFLLAANRVPYGRRILEGAVRTTAKVRERDLQHHLSKRIKQLIDRENRRSFGRAA